MISLKHIENTIHIIPKNDAISALNGGILSFFQARYLAGNESLRKYRKISRQQLALVSSEVIRMKEPYNLLIQIKNYIATEDFLYKKKEITLNDLLYANRVLTPENKFSGKIRKVDARVGGSNLSDAKYICPEPLELPTLLEELLDFINDECTKLESKLIISYVRLQDIHPFYDGNGRTARALLGALLKKNFGLYINPILYRLHSKASKKEEDEYIHALYSLRKVSTKTPFYHPFWQESITWATEMQSALNQVILDTQNEIQSALMFKDICAQTKLLIDYLWRQPVVCEEGLCKKFGWHESIIQKTIRELIQLNILVPKKLRSVAGVVVYSCPMIFAAWQQMDDIIFER